MAYLTETQLKALGCRHMGRNVKISDKASIYNADQMCFADFSRVDDFCVISGKIDFGRNVHVACLCNLAGGTEGIVLEDFAGVAYGSHIITQSDDFMGRFMTNPTIPAKYTGVMRKAVRIGRHSLIGTNSVVFPGVHLAEGTSIGAMSLVMKSTEEWSIYVGRPAIRVKARKKDLLELEKAYLENEGKLD